MANKRRCRHCKKYRIPRDAPHWEKFCVDNDDACMIAWSLEQARKNGKKIRERAQKKEKKENTKKIQKQKDESYSYQLKLTKRVAQKLANTIDSKLVCISCEKPRRVQFCGGHFRTGGGHPEIAVDIRNIHGQCNKECNEQKSGNIAGDKNSRGFTAGILERHGQGLIDYLEKQHPMKRFTPQILKKIRVMYAAETRLIERTGIPSRNWRDTEYDLIEITEQWHKERGL